MYSVSRNMCRVFIEKLSLLKSLLTCLNKCKYQKLFMKVLYNLVIKTTRTDDNSAVHSRQKRGEGAS